MIAPLDERELLKKKIRFYRSFFFAALAVSILSLAIIVSPHFKGIIKETLLQVAKNIIYNTAAEPPHAQEIQRIIDHLSYSATAMFTRPEVSVTLDFDKKEWTLHNIHRFDKSGNLVLEESLTKKEVKTGACGELAAYTYQNIRPLLGEEYDIKFVRAAQSGFFLTPDATHIVLEITPHKIPFGKKPTPYILDPSFKRYGPADQFEDYLFFEKNDNLPFVDKKDPDLLLPIGFSVPMWIHDDYLLSFVVEEVGGKFDSNNFGIALLATKRHHFMSRYVLALQRQEGEPWTLENEPLMKEVLKEAQYSKIRKKMLEIFERLKSPP